MTDPDIEILADPEAVARRAAAVVADEARAAVKARGRFTLVVSGGRTPWAMFGHLAGESMPWRATAIYQVDERVAPAGDPDRNLTHLLASLPTGTGAGIHAMPVEEPDLEAAAAEYARSLPDEFDLVHLGLGPDGHTASLVPGDPVLDVADRAVAITGSYEGRRRMTLTFPALERARHVLWLVTGADKAHALRLLVTGDPSIPAGRVRGAPSRLLADADAAGG